LWYISIVGLRERQRASDGVTMNDVDIEVTFPDGGVYGVAYPDDVGEAWTWKTIRSSTSDNKNLAIIKGLPVGTWTFWTRGGAGFPLALFGLEILITEHDVKVRMDIDDLWDRVLKIKEGFEDAGIIE
jgi:hypothetical protein